MFSIVMLQTGEVQLQHFVTKQVIKQWDENATLLFSDQEAGGGIAIIDQFGAYYHFAGAAVQSLQILPNPAQAWTGSTSDLLLELESFYFKVQLPNEWRFFNPSGEIVTPIKFWAGTVQSNAQGIFTADWSSANFAAPPVAVMPTAYFSSTDPTDQVLATMSGLITATTGVGYTLSGDFIFIAGASLQVAPNITVSVLAVGL